MPCLHRGKVYQSLIAAGLFLAATHAAEIADSLAPEGCDGPGLSVATSRAAGQDLAEVRARVRDAIGFDALREWPAGIRVESSTGSGGDGQRFRLSFSGDGRFIWQAEGRPRFTIGFDGRARWIIDSWNTPYACETDEKSFVKNQLYIWTLIGHWLDPKSDMRVSLLDQVSNEDRAVVSVKLKNDESEYWLVVERATWRPTRVCKPRELNRPLFRLEDYRPVMGFYFPHRMIGTDTAPGGDEAVEEVTVVAAIPTTTHNPYRLEANWTNDTRFDASIRTSIRLKITDSGHLLVRPRIHGQDAGWFLLDSGCSGVLIDPAVAKRLGLSAMAGIENKTKITGGSDGDAGKSPDLTVRRADGFQLGSMRIPMLGLPEVPRVAELVRIDDLAGICGYDVFRRAVLELNIRNRTLAIRDPATYQGKDLDWLDFRYEGRSPVIRCPFEGGHEASFMIDTGDPGSVTIDPLTVEKFDLLKGRETASHPNLGLQRGFWLNRVGRLDWLQIGPHRVEGIPDAEFECRPDPTANYREIMPNGVIGAGLLKDFKVIFDYPHKRVAFIRLPDEAMRAAATQESDESGDEELPER